MLSLFHKLETSKKTRKLQQLPLLKKEVLYAYIALWVILRNVKQCMMLVDH